MRRERDKEKGRERERLKGRRGCRTSRAERRATLEGREHDGERVERAKREREAAEERGIEDEG